MKKKELPQLITTKVTVKAKNNFKIAAANSGKKVYEVSEESSEMIKKKYQPKP